MNLDQLKSQLNTLERKIQLLVGEHQNVKSELVQIKGENQELKELLRTKEGQINDFQNKIKITKIVGSIGSDEHKAVELKRKIDDYVKEIDKCIAHLSK